MAERVLTPRALNRALLARQLLLERSPLPITDAVERVGGLQTQYAPSGYLGLWSRLAGFRRETLTEALTAGRIVQSWVMRATIHMVSARDHPLLTEAVRAPRRASWARAEKRAAHIDMHAVAAAVRRHLADGPRKQVELVALLAADGFDKVAWSGAQLWVAWSGCHQPGPGTRPAPTSTVSPSSGCRPPTHRRSRRSARSCW